MSIVQFPNPDRGLFRIVLPEQATVAQKALKEKIDGLLESLKQRQSEANYATWVGNLATIAAEGFDASQADPQAAMEKVERFAEAVTRPKSEAVPTTRLGAFKIKLPDQSDMEAGISWQEIIFCTGGGTIPPDQLKLREEIGKTLMTLKAIFPENEGTRPKTMTAIQRRYADYREKLVRIAEIGLETPPDPNSAHQWLEELRADILLREGPRLKNNYMKKLGVAAAALAAVSAVVYFVLRNNPEASHLLYAYRNLFVLLTGTMIGTWLSFGLRRPKIEFKDLSALEEDMMEPAVRLIFTGLIAITIAFVFATGMVNVNVGALNSAHLLDHGRSALLIGMLLGVSELALPSMLTRRASQFVSEVGGRAEAK